MTPKRPIKFFTGTASRYIAEKIVAAYGDELGKTAMFRFSDGEFQPSYEESVRGKTVFIIQSTFPPADNLLELLMMIDAAKRASAYKIVAVIPYFGYARQDKKDRARVSIGAKLVADLLIASGVDRVMTMDLHADQIQGFFNIPVDHVYSSSSLVPYIKSLQLENLVIASPDMGGAKRAKAYANFLNAELVVSHKTRIKANEIGDMTVIGDVKDKNVIIVDDMIDTAGTITKAAEIIMDRGATSVRALATHAVLSGPAHERIRNSVFTEVIVSDSIPQTEENDKIKVISIADLFAEVIDKIYNYQSISTSFIV